jgi:hypothetical protein
MTNLWRIRSRICLLGLAFHVSQSGCNFNVTITGCVGAESVNSMHAINLFASVRRGQVLRLTVPYSAMYTTELYSSPRL